MADWHAPQGPFDIPDVPDFVPRRLKPYLFIFFVLIIQFSGGIYLAAASDMVGSTALMTEDILMAGYASLIGLAINFTVMFRIKFRFFDTYTVACCVHRSDCGKYYMCTHYIGAGACRYLLCGRMVQDAGHTGM